MNALLNKFATFVSMAPRCVSYHWQFNTNPAFIPPHTAGKENILEILSSCQIAAVDGVCVCERERGRERKEEAEGQCAWLRYLDLYQPFSSQQPINIGNTVDSTKNSKKSISYTYK